jgi:nicotinate phosphoribosyltransferase
LSVLNFDSAVAAAASRMIQAARGRALIEMGGRRVHEEAAVAAARISCALGFASTSNLEAGRRWGVPTAGTAAHAFTLAYPDERAAFAAQLARQGLETTLLVDTYDVDDGVRTAVAAARAAGGSGPGAVRIDSGDLAETARRVRALLDSLGAQNTKIVASGDLDEFAMERLASAPVEAYGVGTRLVTGSGAPTAELIYKLVAVEDSRGAIVPVAKRSVDKATRGGKKWAWRIAGEEGLAREERILATGDEVPDGGRPLQVPLVKEGEVVHRCSLAEIRSLHEAAVAELGPVGRHLIAPAPALPTTSAGRP